MRWAEGFIAVDWGTTNRRAYLVDRSGACVGGTEDGQGILSVPKGGFGAAVAAIRGALGDYPLLLAGMVGSNRGWIETPYVECPAQLGGLPARLVRVEQDRTAIVPGVSYLDGDRADVMRGEEVQILGAVASGDTPPDCLVCHPGTHNKWIAMKAGRIDSFRTVMTGEIFNLLRERSILSELLDAPATSGEPFSEGVRRGLSSDGLTAELFSAPARTLLGRSRREDGASFVSGLLIGADVRVGVAEDDRGEVIVMGRPELTALYAEALRIAGRAPLEIDGEGAFLAGAAKIVELIA